MKSAMVQVKSIQDKDKRNRVDVGAAKRIVSSGIWNPGEPKKRHSDAGSQEDEAPSKRSKKFLLKLIFVSIKFGFVQKADLIELHSDLKVSIMTGIHPVHFLSLSTTRPVNGVIRLIL